MSKILIVAIMGATSPDIRDVIKYWQFVGQKSMYFFC